MTLKNLLAAMVLQSAVVGAFVSAPAFAQTAPAPARMNPNTATAEQLATAPHMTPALVAAIQAKKPMRTADFDAVLNTALTKQQTAEIYPALFVPISLNRSTKEEMMLIPGISRRMVSEFMEYRPYTSLAQFDKEIGKYVSKKEVDRLRSYVTLN